MVNPEAVGDVDEGAQSDLDIGGMTAEEQATWDAMKAGRDVPTGGDGGDAGTDDVAGDAGDSSGDSVDDDPAVGDKEPVAADGEKRVPPKTISYGKYQRERKKQEDAAAALQAKLDGALAETAKEREQRTRLDERTKMLLDAIAVKPAAQQATEKPSTETDPEPDGEDDPIAHAAWTSRELKRTQKTIADIQAGTQKRETESAAEREERQVYDTYENDLKREATEHPEFAQAFVYLRESRYTELGHLYAGIDINDKAAVDAALTPEQQGKLAQDIQRSFHQEQMLLAREALKSGRSPAKVVMNLARARRWTPEAAAAAVVPAKANGNGNGAAVPARPADAAKPTVTEELAALREGQANSRSLSDGGSASDADMTPERIANMPEDEWEEFFRDYSSGGKTKMKMDRMMGKVPQ